MAVVLRGRALVLVALAAACRTVTVVPSRPDEPSRTLLAGMAALTEGRLDEVEKKASRLERGAPAEAALLRLYLAERQHDSAAVQAVAAEPTGALLRSDRFRLTALARARYWNEGLAAARDDLRAACAADGDPSFGFVRGNACALAAQAEVLATKLVRALASTPGEARFLEGQAVLLARVAINGHKPALFLLDTGAPTTILSRQFATKLKLPWLPDVHETSSDGGGNEVILNPIVLDSVAIGQASVTTTTGHVIDMPAAFHVAGILAPQQTFRGAAIEFDLRAKLIRVLPGQDADNWAATIGEATWSVPVRWVDGNLFVPATIRGVAVWMLFDTGADHIYACNDIAERVGVAAEVAAQPRLKSYTAAGTLEVQEGFAGQLSVGDEPPQEARFMVKACPAQPAWVNMLPPIRSGGFLGLPWLKGRRVLLSADGRRLVFTAPAPAPAAPVVPNS